MEDTIKQIQDGIQGAVDAMTGDPRITCADTGEVMEFRIDQFTRNADGSWTATGIVRRDDGWVKLVAKNGVELGVLSPTSTDKTGLSAKLSGIAIDKGGGAIRAAGVNP